MTDTTNENLEAIKARLAASLADFLAYYLLPGPHQAERLASLDGGDDDEK